MLEINDSVLHGVVLYQLVRISEVNCSVSQSNDNAYRDVSGSFPNA